MNGDYLAIGHLAQKHVEEEKKSRTRQEAIPASNEGLACEGDATETEDCNIESCPVNCEWEYYDSWSSCSKTCGGGERSRTRQVAILASNGGIACEGDATETEDCNTSDCPVNCEWGNYDSWSSCSKTCGRGEKSRTRKEAIPASNGGLACEGDATEIEDCNDVVCPGS